MEPVNLIQELNASSKVVRAPQQRCQLMPNAIATAQDVSLRVKAVLQLEPPAAAIKEPRKHVKDTLAQTETAKGRTTPQPAHVPPFSVLMPQLP